MKSIKIFIFSMNYSKKINTHSTRGVCYFNFPIQRGLEIHRVTIRDIL